MVKKHEEFMTAGHEFMAWLKSINDKLDKIGSLDAASQSDDHSSKLTSLKIIESDNDVTGGEKLAYALKKAGEACGIALEDDKYIVEEEVAFLQDEYDKFNEKLVKTKTSLERSIVQWKDYREMLDGCLRNLDKTRSVVESYKDTKAPNVDVKKITVDKFRQEMSKITEWQRRVESLNAKSQALVAASSVSAGAKIQGEMALVSKGYDGVVNNAKNVLKKLEQNYQGTDLNYDFKKRVFRWMLH